MGKWKKLRRRISAHESQSELLKSYKDLALAADGPAPISRKKFWSFPLRFRKKKKINRIDLGIYNVDIMSTDNLSFESIASIDSGYLIINGSTSIENTLGSDPEQTFPKLFPQTDLNNTPQDSTVPKAITEPRAKLEMKDAIIVNMETENTALKARVTELETQNADLKDEILLLTRREETAMNELLLENTELLARIGENGESVECGKENEADDTKRASEWDKLLQFDEENNVEALLPTTIVEVQETPVSSLASSVVSEVLVLPHGTARIPSMGHIWEALIGTYNILQQRQRLLAWSELTDKFKEFITFVQKFCGDNLPILVSLLGASGLPPADTAANTISRAVQLWILETSRGQEVSRTSWPWRLHQILAEYSIRTGNSTA